MLLLWNIWYYLKNYIFDFLEHYFLKGYEVLIEIFGDGEVVEAQFFGDFVFEAGYYFFLEGSIVNFDHLEKIVMGEIIYDGGFFVPDGRGSVVGGRVDITCFFMSFLICCRWLGKR